MQSCLVMAKDHNIAMQILENKYGGNEPFKGGFNRKPRKEMQIKKRVFSYGVQAPIRGHEIVLNMSSLKTKVEEQIQL